MSHEIVSAIESQLRDVSGIQLRRLLFDDSQAEALRLAFADADLVVLCGGGQPTALLTVVEAIPTNNRPSIIVCGDLTSSTATKLLVRLGVDDWLPSTPDTAELKAAVSRVLGRYGAPPTPSRHPTIISVIGAAGGVGASFIACNLAYIFQTEARKPTVLIDLDRAYAPIMSMLNLKPTRSLDDAISNLDTLDAVAFDGYATHHGSGLKLLSATLTSAVPQTISGEGVVKLITIEKSRHDIIVIAVNRWLDAASIGTLVQSQFVLKILRPEFSDLRAAKRLRSLLTETIGLNRKSIRTVINRHSDRAAVPDSAIIKALVPSAMDLIPEDTALVRRSIDAGIPLSAIDRKAATTRALRQLINPMVGVNPRKITRPFARFWT